MLIRPLASLRESSPFTGSTPAASTSLRFEQKEKRRLPRCRPKRGCAQTLKVFAQSYDLARQFSPSFEAISQIQKTDPKKTINCLVP